MEKVFVLTCDWDCGDGRENQIYGVYANEDDAVAAMQEMWQADKIDSCFAGYFENGELKEEAENDGIDLEERRTYIGICDQYSPNFIEYCITEHKVQ